MKTGKGQVTAKIKDVTAIKRTIDVEGQTSELTVKLDFNIPKLTFKIVPHITTKQVSFSNDALNQALVKQTGEMVLEAIEMAKDLVQKYRVEDDDPNQLKIVSLTPDLEKAA
ncbi:MAG: hypothetical protein AAGG68_28775 [Bacteroidota bacterium]